MSFTKLRSTALYRSSLAVLGAGVLSVGGMAPAASATASAPKEGVTVVYPSSSGAAAAQAGEGFDIDVEVLRAGTLTAEIRAVSGRKEWIPLKVATEALNQVVAAGPVTVLAEAPLGTGAASMTCGSGSSARTARWSLRETSAAA